MFDLVVADGMVVSGAGMGPCHVAVQDGRVAALLDPSSKPEALKVIDASGLLVLPGLVDAHVHFREPGLTHKEDFASGSRAAALGGVTTVMVQPTDNPVTTTLDHFLAKKQLGDGRCAVDFALQVALGPDISHVTALADAGAASFEIFLGLLPDPVRITHNEALVAAMMAVREVDGLVGTTPYDDELAAAAARGAAGLSDGWARFTASLPPAIEAAGIARAVLGHRLVGGRMHIRQVSTALGLHALTMAKGDVTAEVTPHNLSLTEDAPPQLGPVAKVVPPLRNAADVAAMQEALQDGLVDIVATDHAPHAVAEKDVGKIDLGKAPGGFPGVQTLLPVLLKLVGDGVIDYTDLVRVACEAPASIFRLSDRKGSLRPGADADLVLVDPGMPMTIRNEDQASKAGRTPFDGMIVPATPVLTMLRGAVIAERGKTVGNPRGRFLAPA